MDSLQTFIKENEKDMRDSKLKEAYEDYLYKNKAKLEEQFSEQNNFHTSVRGLKVRGVYANKAEAEARSKKLQRTDQIHNIFLGEVGKWLPWDPEPSEVTEQEYAEDQLNTLMKKYKENEEAREMFMRENRTRGRTGPPTSVTRESEPVEGETGTNAAADAPSSFNSMFSGPADLAIQRKLEKKTE
jgi:thymidylate synthase